MEKVVYMIYRNELTYHMRKCMFIIFTFLISALFFGCKSEQTNISKILISQEHKIVTLPDNKTKLPVDVKFIQNVQYGLVDGNALYLDILCPLTPPVTPMPVVLAIHGGGGVSGSKSDSYGKLIELALEGYFCLTIDYRLAPESVFPAQIEDCKCAVRFLRANKDKYGIAEDKIGVWGASTGGYLASMLGTTGNINELEGKGGWENYSSKVQAVVDWYGRTVLFTEELPANHTASIMLGDCPQYNRELARKASPTTYVSSDDPPFLIMHGDKDAIVPLKHSQSLDKELKEKGVDATLYIIEGAGHDFRGYDYCYEYLRDFFNKHLK